MTSPTENPTISETDKRLTFFLQEDGPKDGYTCYTNGWWIKHPTKGLVVWKGYAPQFNTNRVIVERLQPLYPWSVIGFVPVAWVGVGYHD